jgi:hypothetical protein
MRPHFFSILSYFLASGVYAQAPDIAWQKLIGGSNNDFTRSFQITNDQGFLISGRSSSDISGDKTENSFGSADYWVIKLDSNANIQWQRTLGGNSPNNFEGDFTTATIQTDDGGFLVGGYSDSPLSGNKTETCRGQYDYWLIKLNVQGNTEWQKVYGGSSSDMLYDIKQTPDGGYILAGGSASSVSAEKSENSRGTYDFWIIKIDAAGNIQWQRTIGGSAADICTTIIQTPDGGYLAGGRSSSSISGEKTENSYGQSDYWIVKLSDTGNIEWQKTIGGNGSDSLTRLIQASDGNYFASGDSSSPVSGLKTEPSGGLSDYWLLKLSPAGDIVWQKTLGGSNADELSSTPVSLPDGGFLVCGGSTSGISGDKTSAHQGGMYDVWLVRLTADGDLLWQKGIGGSQNDTGGDVKVLSDGSFIFCGTTDSSNAGDVTETGHGQLDYWLVKLEPEQLSVNDNTLAQIVVYPNPASDLVHVFLPQDSGTITATLYDLVGRKISSLQTSTDLSLPLPKADGLYLLSVTT